MTEENKTVDTEKKKPKPKPVKRVEVSLIEHRGESALVQWYDGEYHRVNIPLSEYDFESKTVAADTLQAGIPYGVDWSRLKLEIDPVALREELYKRNIWTKTDLQSKPNQAIAAINKISGMMRRQMLDVAEKGGK